MIHNIDPTEQQAAWRLVEQAWDNFYPGADPIDHAIVVDNNMLDCVLHEPKLKLTMTRAKAHAAVAYWRAKIIEEVEKVAAQYRAEIETSARFSKPPEPRRAADADGL